MFAGFKGSVPLKQTTTSSVFIPAGTSSNRQFGVPISSTTNNIVIGSGYSMTDPTSTGNIFIGTADYSPLGLGNTNYRLDLVNTGGATSRTIIVGYNSGANVGTINLTTGGFVVFGGFGQNGLPPGNGSVAVGSTSYAQGQNSISIGGGNGTTTAATNSIRISPSSQNVTGAYSTFLGGGGITNSSAIVINAAGSWGNQHTDFNGIVSFNTGTWSSAAANGDIGAYLVGNNFINFYRLTSDATVTEIGGAGDFSNTPTNYITMLGNQAIAGDLLIVARTNVASGTDSAAWKVQFLCQKTSTTAASTTMVGTPVVSLIASTAGAATWAVSVVADTTNGRPAIKVQGAASVNIRWQCTGSISRLSAAA